MKWKINIYKKNCTGCMICQMICSWTNEGAFHPSHSLIKVDNDESSAHFRIKIEDSCTNCGLCANYCTSNALVKEKR
ncbi:4Fe-4S binding domain protein [Pelotomaculum sp. FP]|nr:4Fe-4S binding domain protein [Pelotomaculum sp. FP]